MKYLGYLPIETFDSVFLMDDPLNNCNMVGAAIFEPFEYESMKNYLLEKTENLPKTRCKIVSKFRTYWYAPMDQKEWEVEKPHVVQLVENVHTDLELAQFMCQQHTIRESLDSV